ncbi:hypothetical protein WKK05_15275 [Nostoc sp. UHCC 0302]|uniref:hypothetical protein n=1 Tax=Nostoc sp. UHCC 0302 TaxID=3134896 RepID=UPI00311CC4C1
MLEKDAAAEFENPIFRIVFIHWSGGVSTTLTRFCKTLANACATLSEEYISGPNGAKNDVHGKNQLR